MLKTWNRILWSLALPALFIFNLVGGLPVAAQTRVAQASAGSSEKLVQKIEVSGQRRIEEDAIREKIQSKTGASLDREQVRQDIQAILGLGFFDDVQVHLVNGVLRFEVRERPVITKITFEGNDEFDDKELEEQMGIKLFTVLNPSKLRAALLSISKKYEEKGYYLARATHEVKVASEARPEIELRVKVEENERVRVRRIFFSGNQHFTSAELKQVMVTAEGHVFSWATGGGTYREDAFERDIAVLAFLYGNEGYIQAKFTKPRVTLSQDRRYIDIFMDVDEGKRFYLGKTRFEGDLLFTDEEHQSSFAMEDGDVFSTGKLQEEILKLTDKYGDEGYAFANVIPKPLVQDNTEKVDLVISVERGEKVYWGKITVTGNAKTHDKVLRRELPFAEGELYNATKRKKGLERIRRLGFFGADVNFLTSSPSGTNNVLDLEIRVLEKPTGSLNMSAGFGSSSGFVLQGQVGQNNLFGRGQQLSISVAYNAGSKSKGVDSETNVNVQFTDPKAFDTEWLMGGDLYYQDTSRGSNPKTYDLLLRGAAYRIGREIYENFLISGTYKLARSEITNPISEDIFASPKDADSLISSVTTTLTYDTRNNRLDPSGGMFASAAAEFGGLGGRVYQKFIANYRFYLRPVWRFVLRTNVEYGTLANFMTDETVPVSERFVLGGVFSIRGYPYSSVGPGVTVTPTRSDAIGRPAFAYVRGGTSKFQFNQELEMPLIPEADIRAVFFFDAGNAWDQLSDRSPALLSNYGWGLRWYSPLGPLRFEWGFPLSTLPSKGDRGTEFHFIIAPTF